MTKSIKNAAKNAAKNATAEIPAVDANENQIPAIEGQETQGETTNETPSDSAPATETPVEEAKKEYDMGPLGKVLLTEKEHAAFVAQFLGAPETKAVVAGNKELKKSQEDDKAKERQANAEKDTQTALTRAKAAGLEELPKGVKKVYAMKKAAQFEVGANITIGGQNGYFGFYVPFAKMHPLTSDVLKARVTKTQEKVLTLVAAMVKELEAKVKELTVAGEVEGDTQGE